MPHHARTGQRLHLELAGGGELNLYLPIHHRDRPDLTIEVRMPGVTVSGRNLHVNLHDNKSAELKATEADAAGFPVTGEDAIPLTYSVDRPDVVTLTDNGDGTARLDNVDPAAVGETAVVSVVGEAPDGTPVQGTLAVTIVAGPVVSVSVDATEVDPGA